MKENEIKMTYKICRKLLGLLILPGLAVILSLPAALSAQTFSTLRAGAATVDITPPAGTPLSGFSARLGAPSTGTHDPLTATALLLDNGEQKICFVALDTLLLRDKMYRLLSLMALQYAGVPIGNLFLSASHTHAGSGALSKELAFLGGKYDETILTQFIENIKTAIVKANENLQPASIGFGTGLCANCSVNRRENNGPTDPEVVVMRVNDANDKPLAVLFNFSAHPTTVDGMEFSADFPYYARKVLQSLYPDTPALFVNGAQGNQGPGNPCGANDTAHTECLGFALGGEILKVMQSIKTTGSMKINVTHQMLLLNKKMGIYTRISSVVINEAAIVTIPGEAFVEIGLDAKLRAKELGFKHAFVLGLTNDGIGYIPTEEMYHKHGYETLLSLFGPKIGTFMGQQIMKLLDRAKKNSPWVASSPY